MCEHMHCVDESYVHVFMTDGDGFYIHIGDDYDVFVASWGDDLCNTPFSRLKNFFKINQS